MSTNRIRGILFDKDGTLLDFDATWPPAYQAAAEMLAGLAGNPALVNRVMRLGGYGEDGVLDPVSVFACGSTDEISEFCAAIPELDGIQDIAGRVDRLFTEFGEQAPWVVDCLDAILEGLHGRGFALGLATNDSAASAEAWIAHNDFGRLFDFVAGADSGYGAKPDPAVFHAFCARTGLAAHQILPQRLRLPLTARQRFIRRPFLILCRHLVFLFSHDRIISQSRGPGNATNPAAEFILAVRG